MTTKTGRGRRLTMRTEPGSERTNRMRDTTIKKVSSAHSPRGEMGQKYLASGKTLSMRLWEEEPGEPRPETVRDYETVLAGDWLQSVRAPTLLIVGGDDEPVIGLNEEALARLAAPVKKLVIVPGATHLFEEPGKLQEVARLAAEWFTRHLGRRAGVRAD